MSITGKIGDSWSHHDAVRHWMYEKVHQALSGLTWEERPYHLIEFGSIGVDTSTVRILYSILGNRLEPQVTDYPKADIQDLITWEHNAWDILVADQVLEHVERPWLAADEIYRVVKPGGLALVLTPFLHPIHKCPLDCWRIAPDGYRVLFPESRWEHLALDMWADHDDIIWIYNSPLSRGMTGDWVPVDYAFANWPGYGPETDGLHPILIWMIARKK